MAIEKIAAKSGVKVLRISTMSRRIVEASKWPNMRFVGDGIGGFIFPEFQCAFDAMYAIVKILEMLAVRQTRMGQLLSEIPYKMNVQHKKLPCPWDKKGQAIRLAYENVKNKNPNLNEGVKVQFKDAWVLMSPDPDEAYFHLWVEAEDDRRVKSLIKEYSEKISKWVM
jgi:mannose-1-phosphate guanylyltransferase/phosphomannomutase